MYISRETFIVLLEMREEIFPSNDNLPLVSVLIPTYNGEKYVIEALFSVLQQTYPNMEIIVTDDASKDKTVEVVQKFKDEYDYENKIKLILNEKNQWISKNMNRGLESCEGKYVATLDQDDTWLFPKKLEEQVVWLEEDTKNTIIGTQTYILHNEQQYKQHLPKIDQEIRKYISSICVFQHSTVMYRKRAVEKVGGYSNDYAYAMDLELFYKLLQEGRGKNLDIFSTNYKLHGNNATFIFWKKHKQELLKIRRKYRKDFPIAYTFFGMQIGHMILSKYFWQYEWYQSLKNSIKGKDFNKEGL